jgi:uncharacterized protein
MAWWQQIPLEQMDAEQWESLCDGCGKCCVIRLEDEDTGEIHATNVGCKLLDGESCRCKDYPGRQAKVPDCVQLTPENVHTLSWLPMTCAYRLVAESRPLFDWHPLISGDRESVHSAGMSVRGRTTPEDKIKVRNWARRIVRLPGEDV